MERFYRRPRKDRELLKGDFVMIHIVFGESAAGALRHAFRKTDDEVIGFPGDLSVGPIDGIDRPAGIARRFDWERETFHEMFRGPDGSEAVFRNAVERLAGLPDGERVTVWTCENATEQIGLRLACYLLRGREVDVQTVNTHRAMLEAPGVPGVTVDIRHSGELSTEQLRSFYKTHCEALPEARRHLLAEEGEALLKTPGLVRSWQDGSIVHAPESRDDAFILSCVERGLDQSDGEWVLAIRVVGEAMGHAIQTVSDGWFEARIRALVRSGRLEAAGNLRSIRMYKVRLAGRQPQSDQAVLR